jgi:nitronate monooxygenase
MAMSFLDQLGVTIPLVQAPMAGVSTPEMAAAVSHAGALGSIAVGATDAAGAGAMIARTRALTDRPFNVNLFVHATPQADPVREAAWLEALAPSFAEFGAQPPAQLSTIYTSFADDPAMLALLLEVRPAVVSFHFGLPSAQAIAALKSAGIVLLACATSPAEALAVADAGVDVVVAQGIEAGGHRGIFDPEGQDDRLGTLALTRLLVKQDRLPVVAAGGIMDGAGIAAALKLGAVAAQLGTAFVPCPESAADAAFRGALAGPGAGHTVFTKLISGRIARSLPNRFTALESALGGLQPPDYPRTYDAGKALNAAAKAQGESGFAAQWAGQGAPLARALPAAELVALLARELAQAQG